MKVRVAALQLDVRRGEVDANLERVEAGLRAAAERGVELVVLPEMWPTSFVELDRDWVAPSAAAVARVAELSRDLSLVVCGSGFEDVEGGDRPGNVLHVFARGERVLSYAKTHLFSPTGEREGFTAGEAPPRTVEFDVGGVRARVSGVVCYDLRFGPLLESCYAAGAELLVVPAQWPTPRAAHWRALVLGRAAEGQCFVVATNRTGTDLLGRRRIELDFPGNSLVAGPDGTARAEGPGDADADGLVVADVDPEEARELRRRVPVRRDRREDLYGRSPGGGSETPS